MIDPLEAVMSYLRMDGALAALIGTRIAGKRRYTDPGTTAWKTGDKALVLRLNGGRPNVDVAVHEVSIEARCFGGSQVEAMNVYMALVQCSRDGNREPVNTSTGQALLYSFLAASGPSMLWDPDVGMDFVLGFFDAMVAEGVLA
jgi:hypothetical protein